MKLYDELAEWWPVVSSPAEYAEEASEYLRLFRGAASGPLHEVLELGSGGGNNASHLAVVAPDATAETFEPGEQMEAGDEPPGPDGRSRSVRYLMWTLPPEPGASCSTVHFSLLLKERDGSVRAVHDTHHCGVFSRATWLRLFDAVGLDARLEPRILEGTAYDTFVATRRR
jgi:hypothetical protein